MSANPNAAETGYWLGLDTGGTFTDAVLLADVRRVVATAKSLTTPWDLAIGIGRAIRAVLDDLPAGMRLSPLVGEFGRELPAKRTLAGKRAGIDSKKCGHL